MNSTEFDIVKSHVTGYDLFGLPKEDLMELNDLSGDWVKIEDYEELLKAYHELRNAADALLVAADERGQGTPFAMESLIHKYDL